MCASPVYAPWAVPPFLESVDPEKPARGVADALATLAACGAAFGRTTMRPHLSAVWSALRGVLLRPPAGEDLDAEGAAKWATRLFAAEWAGGARARRIPRPRRARPRRRVPRRRGGGARPGRGFRARLGLGVLRGAGRAAMRRRKRRASARMSTAEGVAGAGKSTTVPVPRTDASSAKEVSSRGTRHRRRSGSRPRRDRGCRAGGCRRGDVERPGAASGRRWRRGGRKRGDHVRRRETSGAGSGDARGVWRAGRCGAKRAERRVGFRGPRARDHRRKTGAPLRGGGD